MVGCVYCGYVFRPIRLLVFMVLSGCLSFYGLVWLFVCLRSCPVVCVNSLVQLFVLMVLSSCLCLWSCLVVCVNGLVRLFVLMVLSGCLCV